MHITLDMIGEILKEYYAPIVIHQRGSACPLTGCRLFTSPSPGLSRQLLYLYKISGSMPKPQDNLSYLVVGDVDDSFAETDFISVPASANVLSLWDQVSGIFEKYTSWEKKLMRYAVTQKSVRGLIELSLGLLNNPIAVYDTSLRVVGMAGMQSHAMRFITPLPGYQHAEQGTAASSPQSAYLKEIKSSSGAFIFTGYRPRILTCSIIVNGHISGFVAVPEFNSPFRAIHFMLAETLAFYIALVIKRQDVLRQNIFPADALTETGLSKKYLLYQLDRLGWAMNDTYVVLVVKERQNTEQLSKNYHLYLDLLESIFSGCQAAPLPNSIAVVVRGHTVASLIEQKMPELRSVLLQHGLNCGCSLECNFFPHIHYHYLQAVAAEELASKGDRYYPIALYQNHIAGHLVQSFAQSAEPKHFALPTICALDKYDAEQNGKLVQTLFAYLVHNKNATICAQKLQIPLNMLQSRLGKIKSIATAECLEPEMRLSVLASILMVQAARKQ